jgi:hypothetical protein
MNGDAGALAYNHSVKTNKAQYGHIYTSIPSPIGSPRSARRLPACRGRPAPARRPEKAADSSFDLIARE